MSGKAPTTTVAGSLACNVTSASDALAPGGVILLLVLSFTEGAAVMIAELTGAKMLAPLYGSTLYVWGAVIGVTLLSLTAGYYLGGLLSRRARRREILYWFMLTAALLIVAMPDLAHHLMQTLSDAMRPIPAILLQTSLFLLPPLVLLGACPPLIISLLAKRPAEAGSMAGTVFAVSTVGGIIATFASGFWLIPELGLSRTAAGAGVMLAALPLLLLVLWEKRYIALVYPVLAFILLIPGPPPPAQSHAVVVYQSEGLLGQIKVVDVPRPAANPGAPAGTDRILFVNRMGQTWMNRDTGHSQWGYVNFLRSIGSLLPPDSRVLMLGLGGGIVARELQELGHRVDCVELDPRIAEVATRHFGLKPNGDIVIDDGRHFIRSTNRRYDLIVLDVYQAEIPPGHLLNLEAFTQMRGLLNPGGFFVINYPGFLSGEIGLGGRSIWRTLLAAGYRVHLLPTGSDESSGNNLYIAIPGADEPDFANPRVGVHINGIPVSIPGRFLDPAHVDLEDAIVLRDNRPILERLSLEAASTWREGYNTHFTRPFLELGIPLFE